MADKKKTFWQKVLEFLKKLKFGGKGVQKAEDGGPINPTPKP